MECLTWIFLSTEFAYFVAGEINQVIEAMPGSVVPLAMFSHLIPLFFWRRSNHRRLGLGLYKSFVLSHKWSINEPVRGILNLFRCNLDGRTVVCARWRRRIGFLQKDATYASQFLHLQLISKFTQTWHTMQRNTQPCTKFGEFYTQIKNCFLVGQLQNSAF